MRFMAIWIGMFALLLLCAVIAPRSLLPSTFLAIIPLAAFLSKVLVPTHPVLDGWRWVTIIGAAEALFVWYLLRTLPE